MKQTTLAKPIKVNGVGLHTGADVNMTLRPAPANTGYIFVRTDLDNFEIPASVEYIRIARTPPHSSAEALCYRRANIYFPHFEE